LGNDTTISGQTAVFSYSTPGVYLVNLNIRDNNTDINPDGCANSNLINQVIQVASEADFTGTQALDDRLCFGESTTIEGVVGYESVIYNCPPSINDTIFLSDGSGIVYNACVTVDCFESDAVLTDVSQLVDICINMEHSYLGDLNIRIISPNGQQVNLKSYASGGGGIYLGGANDDITNTPGVGADYCFSMSGTQLLINGPTIITGSNPPSDSIVPGTYLPDQSFANLIGSPLNGDWCLEIIDNLAFDNGYVFSWELNFDPNIPMQEVSFTPEIVSQSWDADSSIVETIGNIITVAPDTAGVKCYTYRVTDDFGCEYTQDVCITVAEETAAAVTYYADFDNDGFGDPNVFIIECFPSPPNGYAVNNLDCNDSDDLVNPNASDSEGNGIDENCDGVDGDILSVVDENYLDVSIYPNPFNNNITLKLPLSLNGNNLEINIYDLNGREVYFNSQLIINGTIVLNDLEKLENAPYFIKLAVVQTELLTIRKLIKI